MDELDISGKRFISSKRAAKENRYHVDYIGQLIRGGKIIGSKVGRTWYVEAESLASYLGKEYTPPTQTIVAETFVAPEPTIEKPSYTPAVSLEKIEKEIQIHINEPKSESLIEKNNQLKSETLADEERVPFSSLTYLSDEEPLVSSQKAVHIEPKKAFKKSVVSPKHTSQKRHMVGVLPLVGIGLVAFAIALGSSYLLTYKNSIQGQQNTASLILSK